MSNPYPPPQGHPYNSPSAMPQQPWDAPPRRGMSTGKILTIIFGSLAGIVLLGCGGCFGLFVVFKNEMVNRYSDQIRQFPAVVQHLGEVSDISFNAGESWNIEDLNAYVFDVQGSKGSGLVIVWEDDFEELIAARLRLSSGREIDMPVDR